jgi:hypothetical protein
MPIRSTALILLLLSAALPGLAEDATGYIPFQCPMTGDSHLHLTRLNGRRLARELVLRIPYDFWAVFNPTEWFDYAGDDCSRENCEPLLHSRVQIAQVSRDRFMPFRARYINRMSGNFQIDLRDGRKLSGSFKAKLLKPPRGAVCE